MIAIVPSYQSLYEVARSRGAEVTLVPMGEGWTLDVDAVRAALRPNTKLIVLNAPNSPTGLAAGGGALRELFELGPRVFVDEVYRFLEHEPRDLLPAAADLGGVSLGVMSKAFGLAGIRIGWLATRDAELRERIVEFKHYLTICSAGPSELLAIIALRARDAVLARSRAIVEANLPVLDEFIARNERVQLVRPRAGTTGLIELRRRRHRHPRPRGRRHRGRDDPPGERVRLAGERVPRRLRAGRDARGAFALRAVHSAVRPVVGIPDPVVGPPRCFKGVAHTWPAFGSGPGPPHRHAAAVGARRQRDVPRLALAPRAS